MGEMSESDRSALAKYPGARWREPTAGDRPSDRPRVCVDVTLRRVADGVERVHVDNTGFPVAQNRTIDDVIDDVIDGVIFWWTEGNGGCDCNRSLSFAAAAGEPEPDPLACTFGVYVITAPTWLAKVDAEDGIGG
jgi:hypothetical protein